jgi:hypothetical protein
MHFLQVNFAAVLTAAVIQWPLGYLWYGVLFSKDYKALVQKSGDKPSSIGGVMALIFVANLILSFALAKVVNLMGVNGLTFGSGGLVGAICGLGFVIPPHVCAAYQREEALQTFWHQCAVLADRHVCQRRHSGHLAMTHTPR